MELLGKYMAKLLYGQDDRKFENEYLKKLEKNWKQWKNDQKECEEEELEWKEDEQTNKVIWGEETVVSPEEKP